MYIYIYAYENKHCLKSNSVMATPSVVMPTASIQIIINPPVWEKIWFRLFLSLMIFIILIFLYRIRTNHINTKNIQLEKHNEELNKQILKKELAEKETMRLRKYLSNIIDSMPSILVGVDSEGKVTQWNKTTEQNTGDVG